MSPLADRILCFVRSYLAQHERSPTLEEIGRAVGVRSRGTVHRYVQGLITAGCLERSPGWRGLRLAQRGDKALPLLGRIAGGRPIEALPERTELDPAALLLGPDRYVLQVRGDSMTEAGILDGDYVVLRRADTAESGQIVSALIDGAEATLKRLRWHQGGRIELLPANAALRPMVYAPERVRIQGVLVGVLRLCG